jgi:hypothetical protein
MTWAFATGDTERYGQFAAELRALLVAREAAKKN